MNKSNIFLIPKKFEDYFYRLLINAQEHTGVPNSVLDSVNIVTVKVEEKDYVLMDLRNSTRLQFNNKIKYRLFRNGEKYRALELVGGEAIPITKPETIILSSPTEKLIRKRGIGVYSMIPFFKDLYTDFYGDLEGFKVKRGIGFINRKEKKYIHLHKQEVTIHNYELREN